MALSSALAGTPSDIALDLFFSINLDDEEAISKRKEELESNPTAYLWQPSRPESITKACSQKFVQLDSQEQDLAKLVADNNALRIRFLKLNKEEREKISQQIKTKENDFGEVSEAIKTKVTDTEKSKEIIDQSKLNAQKDLKKAKSTKEAKAAELKIEIERYRSSLAESTISWLADLQTIVDKYKTIAQKIKEAEQLSSSKSSYNKNELALLYNKINAQWRTLIDDGYNVYSMISTSDRITTPPIFTPEALNTLNPKDRELITALQTKATIERQNFLDTQRSKIAEHFEDFYLLLDHASNVRSNILNLIEKHGGKNIKYDKHYFEDVARETLAIPFRLAGTTYQKFLATKDAYENGFWGIIEIAKNLIILILILFIPLVSISLAKKITDYLDNKRSSLLKRRKRFDEKVLSLALWIQRVTPYVPWLVYGLILRLFYFQISATAFEQIQIILPILGYVILYKIFRQFVRDLFQSIRHISGQTARSTRNLVNSTSKTIGYFFLVAFSFLYLTEQTVDQGLVYRQISMAVDFFGLIICAIATNRWKDYISAAAEKVFTSKFGNVLNSKCQGRMSVLFSLPTLILIILRLVFDWIWEWISNLEMSKKFLAKVFRKKFESLVGEKKPTGRENLPTDYTSLFSGEGLSAPDLRIQANQKSYSIIKAEIDGWLSQREEDQSIAIYGDKGIGKTTLLDQIALDYSNLNVIRISIPPKIWKREILANYIAEILGVEKGDNLLKTILEFNKQLDQNTIILVDDAHNLFLGKYGGFDALNAYIEAVNLKTDRIFWCSAFNIYVWAYLKGVLGSSQYLRTEVFLDQWTDDAIKELILRRHNQSNYSLSYDQIILASRSSSSDTNALIQAEEQFFRLLWEQSNGNPRVALHLWTNCLTRRANSTLRVGIPERPEADILTSLDDNCWFVLAAIAKHDNLTRNEAVSATNLTWPQVAHAIKLGVENKILHREGSRYRLHFTHQYDVLKQLRMKNFIYGSS